MKMAISHVLILLLVETSAVRRIPTLKFRGGSNVAAAAPFKLRGGSSAAAAAASFLVAGPAYAASSPQLVNCFAGASSFFGNVRVPAALLAGAALQQFWASPEGGKRGGWLKPVFAVLVALTIVCEFLVLLVATAASTHLMQGTVNPMATSTMAFLMQNMELEYIACRFNFFGGLLCFMFALALRVWGSLPGSLGSGLALLFGATGLHFIAYFNKTIVSHSHGILGLAWRFFTLLAPALGTSAVGALSIAAYVASAAFVCKAVWESVEEK